MSSNTGPGAIAKAIGAGVSDEAVQSILDSLEINWEALIQLLGPELAEAGTEGAMETLLGLRVDDYDAVFDRASEAVQFAAEQRAAQLVGMHRTEDGRFVPSEEPGIAITESTRGMLRSTVRQAIDEGWSTHQLQTNVMDTYAFSASRALNIARTETHGARMQGGLFAAQESGVVESKTWVLGEENACDVCLANAAQGPIALDADFASGDAAPGCHVNCMCTLSYQTVGQSAGSHMEPAAA